jgi:hypothetical protein
VTSSKAKKIRGKKNPERITSRKRSFGKSEESFSCFCVETFERKKQE